MQKRRNSIASALDLRPFYIKPSMLLYYEQFCK